MDKALREALERLDALRKRRKAYGRDLRHDAPLPAADPPPKPVSDGDDRPRRWWIEKE